jgi:hypothetical protein
LDGNLGKRDWKGIWKWNRSWWKLRAKINFF